MKRHKRLLAVLLATGTLLLIVASNHLNLPLSTPSSLAESPSQVLVDQFGYRPTDPKVAVIVQSSPDPEAKTEIPDYLSDTFQVIDQASGKAVYTASPTLWKSGAIHDQSGDRASWLDFSAVQTPGEYLIRNARTGATSAVFQISANVYRDVLVAATRMFFYQRSGYPKQPPYADARWTDAAAFLGPSQDTEARFIDDKDNAALERDLHGGWFDAGDTNKYVTFAVEPVHQLLDAYTQNPAPWTDDFNIPESGNGIPDLIDEVNFELAWLQRMQDRDGGAFIKIGTTDYNSADKPSLDRRPRFYGPKCSSSTIAIAGMFAHAAVVFRDIPALAPQANHLQKQAIAAWNWFNSHPLQTDCDTQEIKAGDADRSIDEQHGLAVNAAIYLLALTTDPAYDAYILQHFQNTRPFTGPAWSVYEAAVGDALLAYTTLDVGSQDIQQAILQAFNRLVQHRSDIYGESLDLDPYRGYMPDDQYHWGSNSIKSKIGSSNFDVTLYSPNQPNLDTYKVKALDIIHYLHGVNPLSLVYLTNMYEYGAEQAANEMYHEWFGHGVYSNALTSPNGPAPGYVTGGPNKNYTGPESLANLPPMKAYLDSNKGEKIMWEITEPAIYYQSAYIKLLSKFCT